MWSCRKPGRCRCGWNDRLPRSGAALWFRLGLLTCGLIDECPNDPQKTEAGACGCGIPDNDSDGDGSFDCQGCVGSGVRPPPSNAPPGVDRCPQDVHKTDPGVCGCGVPENDGDSDQDMTENCIG